MTITVQVPKGFSSKNNNGRILWNGGGCPVPEDTLVEAGFRGPYDPIKDVAKHLSWPHTSDVADSDIVSYRVLPQYNPDDVAFKKEESPRDKQVGGTHYAEMEIQPWDAINVWSTPEMVLGYHINTSVSYLARFRAKGGLQDIKKAHHHLSELIRYFEEQEEYPF